MTTTETRARTVLRRTADGGAGAALAAGVRQHRRRGRDHRPRRRRLRVLVARLHPRRQHALRHHAATASSSSTASCCPATPRRSLRDIRARTDQPIRYVTNSHHHPDHVFGNLVFAEAGAELVSSYFTARMIDGSAFWYLMFLAGRLGRAPAAGLRRAAQHVRALAGAVARARPRCSSSSSPTARPSSGESVDVTMAWFPQAKVLHVADTVWPGAHTFFADGTSVPDWFIQLGHIRELVNELKPRVIVPGHGAPGDAGMIDAQERYLRAVSRMVEDYCRGGEVAAQRRGQGQAPPGDRQRVPRAPQPHPARHQPPAAADARPGGVPHRPARRRHRRPSADVPLDRSRGGNTVRRHGHGTGDPVRRVEHSLISSA